MIAIESELDVLGLLKNCHVVVEKEFPDSMELLEHSEDLWLGALTHCSRRFRMFNSLAVSSISS
jgi:hypothetical protein